MPEQPLRATENLRKTLAAGITTVRDVGSGDFVDVGAGLRIGDHARLLGDDLEDV